MNDFCEEEFILKLTVVLKRITDGGKQVVHNNYMEKLLSNLRTQSRSDVFYREYLKAPEIFQWLLEVVQLWKVQNPSLSAANFIIYFMGILGRREDGFKTAAESNILDEIIKVLYSPAGEDSTLRVAFIKFLNDVLDHEAGRQWVISNKHWKFILNWFFSSFNFYIEQEGLIFLKKLLCDIHPSDGLVDEIFNEVLLPLGKMEDSILLEDENYCKKLNTSLKLFTSVLRKYILSHPQVVVSKLSKIFNVREKVKFILENCKREDTLERASGLFVLFSVLKFEDKSQLLVADSIPSDILDIFTMLLQKNQINCLIKLFKFCQLLWSEMRSKLICESTLDMHFIIFQFIPMCALKIDPESKMFDTYVQKLFHLTSQSSQKFGFALRDTVRKKRETKNWALKGVLSVTGNADCLKQDEAVLIFQFLAYALVYFVPESLNQDQNLEYLDGYFSNKTYLDSEDVCLLSAVLNSLCLFIEKFKINWAESLESLCLLKMACDLLKKGNLSCVLVVQTLLLVKLAILNSMSPNLAFLLNKSEDSSFECLLPLLYKHLHNPSWEIRDSCIEVVTTITELAESKYPSLQKALLDKDFYPLVLRIMEGDSESYVRASALRALTAMTSIKNFQSQMSDFTLSSKIMNLLRTESEGIVRREAVLFLNQIYQSLELTPEQLRSFFEIMAYAATSDLHWEVKVNALTFWDAVIQRVFADQGMIDGSFPKVTFSKEHKKIVTITPDEIKVRLGKALLELSRVGCLHVLMTTLYDDCDYQVVEKSAKITMNVLNILKRFDVLKGEENQNSIDNRTSLKRKHGAFGESSEERKLVCKITKEEGLNEKVINDDLIPSQTKLSDDVIEEIVNEMDINLLVSVHRSRENGSETSAVKTMCLREIKPEVFLMKMENFELKSFLKDKKKWLVDANSDLKSLVNDIMMVNSFVETNVMDCY